MFIIVQASETNTCIFHDLTKLEKLKNLKEKVNWKIEKERHELLGQLYPLVREWTSELPNLRDIFRPKEIELLLSDALNCRHASQCSGERFRFGSEFIDFVVRSGYKDQPEVDKNGKISSRRTTPIHHAVDEGWVTLGKKLFGIYDRYDVNYTDETTGYTHFHAACASGPSDVVEKFLDLGQDIDIRTREGDSPLHLALEYVEKDIAELLLRRGADPNSTNAEGSTPLHFICELEFREDLAEMLFEICDEKHQVVRVDARDECGRTPLQYAVATIGPNVIDVLLDRGADLSSFVFPTESLFDECLVELKFCKFLLASGLLATVDRLVRRGYELDRGEAATIMKIFAKCECFDKSTDDLDERWYDDEEFRSKAKELTIKPNLSLDDLIRLRLEEAAKLVTYTDYFDFAKNGTHTLGLEEQHAEPCLLHLCEKLSRGFFRSWALYPFWELIHYRLPLECCEMVLANLNNEDLYHIYLAATEKYENNPNPTSRSSSRVQHESLRSAELGFDVEIRSVELNNFEGRTQ
ncbi:unnamed protein product [Trichogramma brassicae]|uniref:Uncharacterized protein n=1 Tax=Trichogramma brassicae TaxID=86971 RepID=A0A6H5HXS8_9HYME|nr:unnamed protein product [Trichogramma brassicae]